MSSDRYSPLDRSRLWRAVAIIGLLSLAVGVFAAHQAVPSGYELSIYAATPAITWIGFGLAVCATIGLSIGSDHQPAQRAGIGLALLTVFSFTSLPLIRGYYLYASSDTFYQLGLIRDLVAGFEVPEIIIYPGSHVFATELTLITEMTVTRIIMLLVPVFVVLYSLCTEITSRRLALARHHPGSGVIIGAIIAPIMTVQLPNLQMTPLTLAVIYLSFVLFCLTLYQLNPDDWRTSGVLFIALLTLVLLHPLVAVAVAAFFGGFAILRLLTPRSHSSTALPAPFRIIAGAGAVLGLVIFIQIFDNPVFQGSTTQTILQLTGGIDVTGGVSDRASGLDAIGVSVWEILLKIFVSKIVVGLFAAAVVLHSMRAHISNTSTRSIQLIYLYGLSLIPIGGLAGLVFAAGKINLVTRFIGIALVLLSVFAAIGIGMVRTDRQPTRPAVIGLGVVLLLTVAFAGSALFASPYIYQDTPHVPESEQVGYATLFEYRGEDVSIGSTRSLVERHRTAYYGQRGVRGFNGIQPNSEAISDIESDRPASFLFPYGFNQGRPSDNIHEPTYLVLPESDRVVDLELYDGLRYAQEDYARMRSDPHGSHIYSSDGFDIYYFTPTEY